MQGSPSNQDQHASLIVHQIDEQHFEHIYRNCWKSVFEIIFHYSQDQEIAEQISQGLFASLWGHRQKIIIKTTVEQYLNQAAKLEAFEYLRTGSNYRGHISCVFQDRCGSHNSINNPSLKQVLESMGFAVKFSYKQHGQTFIRY